MTTEKEYINGCYTREGSRPLREGEIERGCRLKNGMFAVFGIHKKDGISADVYRDRSMKSLVFMEHGFVCHPLNWDMICNLVEWRCEEMGI